MKVLNIIALVTSIACVVISAIQKDWTEAAAWLIVTLYNTQNLITNLLNDK
jgi:hypothetical protein